MKTSGVCELNVIQLNPWVAWWSTGHMAELMGKHFKTIGVLFTLWGCRGHESCTLACWTHECFFVGWKNRWLSSWEPILHPSNFCLRCKDVGCMWTIRYPAELMGGFGWLGGVQGILLNSWGSIWNPSEFCAWCEGGGAMITTLLPAELMGRQVK